ncbi:UNVERIFIED_CONTAM: hypothetical protein BEN50_24725 [Euhalothece sp. KZN 001]
MVGVSPMAAAHRSVGDIRDAGPSDVDAIARIEAESFQCPLPVGWFDRATQEARVGVAVRGDEVIGFVVGQQIPTGRRGRGHIADLAVREPDRGRGRGRAVLRWVLERFDGCGEVWLEVRASNQVAQTLYSDEGFSAVGRRPGYYSDGEAAVIMTRQMSVGD